MKPCPSARRPLIAGIALTALVAGVVLPAEARAWYLPEHIVITEQALSLLPPVARHTLQRAWSEATSAEGDDPLAVERDVCKRFYTAGSGAATERVSFAALPAIAADHSTTTGDLAKLLRESGIGERLVRVAWSHWDRFQKDRLATDNKTVKELDPTDRASIVDNINAALALIDRQYLSRANGNRTHFCVADESVAWTLQGLGEQGRVDNALGQFAAHHLRSLELAVRARGSRSAGNRLEAILEHAYAVHFLQDAFATGHAATTARDRAISDRRIRRHGYFNRNGLHLSWALNRASCAAPRAGACSALPLGEPPPTCVDGVPLGPCWMGYGDGYLAQSGDGFAPDEEAPDYMHVAFATAKAQMLLALALDEGTAGCFGPDTPQSREEKPACFVDAKLTGCDQTLSRLPGHARDVVADLLDPAPRFSTTKAPRCGAARAERIIASAQAALKKLAVGPARTSPVDANFDKAPPTRQVVPPDWVGEPFTPLEQDDVLCEGASRFGQPDVALLRPVLAVWPVPVAPPAELPGMDSNRWGWSVQFWGALTFMGSWEARDPYVLPSLAAGAGVSYRAESFLAERPNVALAELSVGLSGRWKIPVEGGTARDQLVWFTEIRVPSASSALWAGVAYVTGAVPRWQGRFNLVPAGGRLFFGTDENARVGFRGFDLEGPAFVFPWATEARARARLSPLPWELRTRIGWVMPDGKWPSSELVLGLELAGGISHPFREVAP